MKRVIAFVILLTLPIGFLLGAHKTVDALKDDVTMEVTPIWGDADRVAGKTFQILTTCGEHMWWETDHTAGDPGVTQTQFHFSQEGHGFFERQTDWTDFSLHNTSGMGMSTSGGDGLTFENKGLGAMINAVAKNTLPGESREEIVPLEEYFDYYPLEYWVDFRTEDYYVDEMYDVIQNMDPMYDWGEDSLSSYEQWIEHFRFPIMPGDTMTISVGKDETGAIREIGVNNDGSESPYINFTAIPTKTGMYFSPVFQTWDGLPITTGEYTYGHGLYYIPFKPVGHTEGTPPWMTFDFDGLEMVYSLEPTDRLVAMEVSSDGEGLHMLTQEEGQYVYCLFDIPSRKLLSRTEILQTNAGATWQFFPEEELLFLIAGDRMALVEMGEDSRVEFSSPWPEEVEWILPSAVVYDNGVLYGVSLQWYEENRGVSLMACDENGLGYLGHYRSNLNGQGYNSYWVNMESVEFVIP